MLLIYNSLICLVTRGTLTSHTRPLRSDTRIPENSNLYFEKIPFPLQGYAYVAIGLAASAFLTFPVAVAILKPKEAAPAPQPAAGNPSKANSGLQEIVIAGPPPDGCAAADGNGAVAEPRWAERESRRAALTNSVSAPVGAAGRARHAHAHASPFSAWQRAGEAVSWQADGAREAGAFERLNSLNARRAMLAVSVPEDCEGEQLHRASEEHSNVKEMELVQAQTSGKSGVGGSSKSKSIVDMLHIR